MSLYKLTPETRPTLDLSAPDLAATVARALSELGFVSLTGPIVSITNDSGIALVTTDGPHRLTSGQLIDISGNSVAAYNGAGFEVSPNTATTFYFGVGYAGEGAGGRWAMTSP